MDIDSFAEMAPAMYPSAVRDSQQMRERLQSNNITPSNNSEHDDTTAITSGRETAKKLREEKYNSLVTHMTDNGKKNKLTALTENASKMASSGLKV